MTPIFAVLGSETAEPEAAKRLIRFLGSFDGSTAATAAVSIPPSRNEGPACKPATVR